MFLFQDEKARSESESPTNTMLVISLCFPYMIWTLSYTAKSFFGSNSWPSYKMIIVVSCHISFTSFISDATYKRKTHTWL